MSKGNCRGWVICVIGQLTEFAPEEPINDCHILSCLGINPAELAEDLEVLLHVEKGAMDPSNWKKVEDVLEAAFDVTLAA